MDDILWRSCRQGMCGGLLSDITGEVPLVERMISGHGSSAGGGGSCPMSLLGYDCVPAELGMWLMVVEMEGGQVGELSLNFRGNVAFPVEPWRLWLDGIDGKFPQSRATHDSNQL
jgi:hypothetical protein